MASKKKKKERRSAARQIVLDARREEKRRRLDRASASSRGRSSRPYTNEEKPGPRTSEARYASLSQKAKSLVLTQLLKEAFGVVADDEITRISRTPSATELATLVEHVMHLWPKDWREGETRSGEGFNVLVWADQTPHTVSNALIRCSLYADRVFICNPCTNIMLYHPQSSPLLRPELWLHDYALSAVFMALIQPWIEADVVELVQNPIAFDVALFPFFRELGMQRISRNRELQKLIDEEAKGYSMLAEMLVQHPRAEWTSVASLLPLTPTEQREAIRHAEALALADPIRAAIPAWLGTKAKRQMVSHGNGLSYDQAIALATSRHAQIVTHEPLQARVLQLDSEQLTGPFQQAAQSLAQSQLSFLNNVTTDFAVGLRKDGKLRDFRQYVSSLARGIQFRNSAGRASDSAATEFLERFESEYARYRAEWGDIQRKLATGAFTSAIGGAASSAAAYLTGSLAVYGPLATAASAGMAAVLSAFFERRKLDRQPLGVVLQLDRTTHA